MRKIANNVFCFYVFYVFNVLFYWQIGSSHKIPSNAKYCLQFFEKKMNWYFLNYYKWIFIIIVLFFLLLSYDQTTFLLCFFFVFLFCFFAEKHNMSLQERKKKKTDYYCLPISIYLNELFFIYFLFIIYFLATKASQRSVLSLFFYCFVI